MGERGNNEDMKNRKTSLEPLEPELAKPEAEDSMTKPGANHKSDIRPGRDVRLGREVQARIGQQLRAMYDDVVNEGVPQHIADLVHRLSDQENE
jgi:Anti-sigma factor NepR